MISRSPPSPNGGRHRSARLPADQRLLGEPPQRMIGRQRRRSATRRRSRPAAARASPGSRTAARPCGLTIADGVLEVLDGRLEVRHLTGHLRPVGRQLRADGVEERAELAELVVLLEIEPDAELAAAEPRQPAPDHVNRPQEQLREAASPTARRRPARRAPWQSPGLSDALRSCRISSVETPMRIEPNSMSPSSSGWRNSRLRPWPR